MQTGYFHPKMTKVILGQIKRFPWVTNVTLYSCLFAGGDSVYQWFSNKEKMDWTHTRRVAVVVFSFHGNFSYFWMRGLERRFPGKSVSMVLRKLLLDQTVAAPTAISAFYTGLSLLEGKEDILKDWRDKFLNTYKTGLMYWPFVQFLNFILVPPYLRTVCTGCSAFFWATFMCFSQQSGDGTVSAAMAWILTPKKEDPAHGPSTRTQHMDPAQRPSTRTQHMDLAHRPSTRTQHMDLAHRPSKEK